MQWNTDTLTAQNQTQTQAHTHSTSGIEHNDAAAVAEVLHFRYAKTHTHALADKTHAQDVKMYVIVVAIDKKLSREKPYDRQALAGRNSFASNKNKKRY